MRLPGRRTTLIFLLSLLLTLALAWLLAEWWLGYRYERWREMFAEQGDWYDGLSRPSTTPGLLWEYRPNSHSDGHDFPTIRTNHFGFRGKDIETPKAPDTHRIGIIGDSVALGFGVHEHQTISHRLERFYANQTSPRVEVLNFGMDGYSAGQIAALATQRLAPFELDQVIYLLCLNDFDDTYASGDKLRYFNRPNSFVLHELEGIILRHSGVDYHQWFFDKNHINVYQHIAGIHGHLQQQGQAFQVVILPVFRFHHDQQGFSHYPLRQLHKDLGAHLESAGIRHLDLLPLAENSGHPPTLLAYDAWHLTASGHQWLANVLAEEIVFP